MALALRQPEPKLFKKRTDLSAPIILYSGHQGEIYTLKFSPDGSFFASAGHERQIFLWNTFDDHANFATISGHTGAILDLRFNAEGDLVTCATDKTVSLWDMTTGSRLRKFKGHQAIVNSCATNRRGQPIICSGSDDATVKLWDSRRKGEIMSFQNIYQITSVEFSDNSELVFAAGIDNSIKVWDIGRRKELYTMSGHSDTVTGLSLSPDGSFLLSNSMDNTLRIWDVRPYAPTERCFKMLIGHQHNFEKNLLRCAWSPDGRKVTAGSADRFVYVWDVNSGRVIYKLPGHSGSVNQTIFHPKQSIIASCSSDKKIYLGEI